MSRRAIKAINWAAIAERVPEHQRNQFAAFKTKSDQYLRRMTANPEAAPQIDWEFYRKNVTLPGLVEKFKQQYEALNIPYPDDKYTHLIESEEKEVHAKIEEFRKNCEVEIEKFKESIATYKAIMPYEDMTLEEFLEYHPEYETGTVNKPSIWPHTEEMQEIAEQLERGELVDEEH